MVRLPQTPQNYPKMCGLLRKQQLPEPQNLSWDKSFSQKKERNTDQKNKKQGQHSEQINTDWKNKWISTHLLLTIPECLGICRDWLTLFGKYSICEKHELWSLADLDSCSSFATYLNKLPNFKVSVPTLEKYIHLFTRTFSRTFVSSLG